MLFKLFSNIFKKINNLLIESSKFEMYLYKYPFHRQKPEHSMNTVQWQKYYDPRYPQFVTLRVKDDGFEVIYKKK